MHTQFVFTTKLHSEPAPVAALHPSAYRCVCVRVCAYDCLCANITAALSCPFLYASPQAAHTACPNGCFLFNKEMGLQHDFLFHVTIALFYKTTRGEKGLTTTTKQRFTFAFQVSREGSKKTQYFDKTTFFSNHKHLISQRNVYARLNKTSVCRRNQKQRFPHFYLPTQDLQ